MRQAQLSCPHCGTEAAGFVLLQQLKAEGAGVYCFLQCNICAIPIIALYPGGAAEQWISGQRLTLQVDPIAVWPSPRSTPTPNAVPPNIASLYVQAMASLQRHHYDAAGPLLRRIMEVSLKVLHPEGKGSLYDRIEGLPDEKGITPTMKEWAHAIRLMGRNATHDEDLVTKEDAEDMQAFVELFLVYAFDLPSRIAIRKAAHTTAAQSTPGT